MKVFDYKVVCLECSTCIIYQRITEVVVLGPKKEVHCTGCGRDKCYQRFESTVVESGKHVEEYYKPASTVERGVLFVTDTYIPELMSNKDVEEYLGWKKGKVSSYIHKTHRKIPNFPQPIQYLSSGPVWTKDQIQEYEQKYKESKTKRMS
ncbi:hypothetical protein [Brevibacillus sp. SYSU BS000544]|uniref:hypothetical protein n=1 Tax=Brevibacillus sp. SYSU BS000544 TaxID=3416443 RepID=UPI003CE592A4